jgi:hypothetical protein
LILSAFEIELLFFGIVAWSVFLKADLVKFWSVGAVWCGLSLRLSYLVKFF